MATLGKLFLFVAFARIASGKQLILCVKICWPNVQYFRHFGLCTSVWVMSGDFEIAKTIIPQFRIVQYGFINVHVHIGYAAIENAFNNRHRRINNR